MANSRFEFPEEWGDPVGELRKRVESLPEDDEDRLIREGEERFAALGPEEQARIRRVGDELLERMQTPENKTAVDQAFRHFGETRSS